MSAPAQDFALGRAGLVGPTDWTDDFERSNGSLGNGWTNVGITSVGGSPDDATRYLSIVSGRATLNGVTGAGYGVRTVPGLKEIRLGFQFSAGTSNNATALGFVSSKVPISAGLAGGSGYALNSVHVSISPSARGVNYYNGSISASVDTDTFTLAATTDYEVRLVKESATTLRIYDPDGGSEALPTGWENLWGDTFYFEALNSDLGHKLPSINYVTLIGEDGLVLHLRNEGGWEQEGDSARVSGVIRGMDFSTIAAMKAARDQVEAYGPDNTDESVVPVSWAQDSTRDGYYQVQQTKVDAEVTGRPMTTAQVHALTWPFSAELRRVPGFTLPTIEVVCRGADRTNSHTVTGEGWAAWPNAILSSPGFDASASLVGGGSVRYDEGDGFYDASFEYSIAPDDYYEGAPTFRTGGFGTSYPIAGAQPQRDPTGWVLSNGLVRIRPSPTESNHFIVGIRSSAASDYDEKAYRFGFFASAAKWELGYDGTTRDSAVGVTVLKNRPEIVAVRITYGITGANEIGGSPFPTDSNRTSLTVDFTLRRGQFYAECLLSAVNLGSTQYGVWRSTVDAGTSITAGIEDNAADSAGNKWQIYTPRARTADTTNGGLYRSAAGTTLPFAIGNDRTIFTGVTFSDSYFAAQNHRQRIVTR